MGIRTPSIWLKPDAKMDRKIIFEFEENSIGINPDAKNGGIRFQI
jgi:hypothetical protein